ncbi:MAG: hypothetical protein AAGI09_06190 [Pseudomonadota bacterium]
MNLKRRRQAEVESAAVAVVIPGTNQRYPKIPFSPAQTEITAENLKVDEHIPEELSGLYIRNGPNTIGPTVPYQQ